MNRQIVLAACLLVAYPSSGPLQASVPLCPQGQTTIYFVNGVKNTYDSAQTSLAELQRRLQAGLPRAEFECLDFALSYNASTFDYFDDLFGEGKSWLKHGAAFAADTASALGQNLNNFSRRFWAVLEGYAVEREWDYLADDFASRGASVDRLALSQAPEIEVHAQEYVRRINGLKRKVVIVGHSQGSSYANLSYRLVPQEISESLGLVPVASFEGFVAGQVASQEKPYSYTTLVEDAPILAAIAFASSLGSDGCTSQYLPFPGIFDLGPMCPNIANLGKSADPLGHNFINAYLIVGSNSEHQIVQQVRERVSEVKIPATRFAVGDRVRISDTSMSVPVLDRPLSGAIVGMQSSGSLGVVRSSPRGAASDRYWYVDFDEGVDGWVREVSLVTHEDDGLDVRVSFVNNETCGHYGVCSVVLDVGEWADIASIQIEIDWGDGTTLSSQTLADCLSAGACQHLGGGRYRVWKLYAESRVTPYPLRVSYGVVGGAWVNESFSANVSAKKELGLNATPGDARVDLSWANLGADRYNVCRASQPVAVFDNCSVYAGGTLILDVGAPPRSIRGLTNGTTYRFRVEAQFGTERIISEGASATPEAVVPPPTSGGLNDTGVTDCRVFRLGDWRPGPCTGDEPWGQDVHYGRDAAALAGMVTKLGDGSGGFDFTKISNSGNELAPSAALGSGPSDWACTRDNVTGLMWEVKVDSPSHLRHQDYTYTWYDPNSPDGRPGASLLGTCVGSVCNTNGFVQTVNGQGLCGARDWRMPTQRELLGIVNFGQINPAIDSDYFPNTPSERFWSGSPLARYTSSAWFVHFGNGASFRGIRDVSHMVRLVSGGP